MLKECQLKYILQDIVLQGRSQDFSKGGGGGVTEATHRCQSHSCIIVSYYRGIKAYINLRQKPLTKILYKKANFKKVGFSTMAFTAKTLSWRFRHLNIVGCLLKRRPTMPGGSRAPQHPPPPSYAPVLHTYKFRTG